MSSNNGQDLSREDPRIKIWKRRIISSTKAKNIHRAKLEKISNEVRNRKVEIAKHDADIDSFSEYVAIFQNAQLILLKASSGHDLDEWENEVLEKKRSLEEEFESEKQETTRVRPKRKSENKAKETAGAGKEKRKN